MKKTWSWPVWVLLAALAAVVAAGLLELDRFVAQAVIGHVPDGLQKTAHLIGKTGLFTCVIPAVVLASVWMFKRRWSKICIWLIVAEAFSGLISLLLKISLGRWRPKQMAHDHFGFEFFTISPKCSSFPSGHVNDAAAVATVLWFVYPRLRPLYVFWVLLMASARVCSLDHFVADVAAGAMVGLVCTLLTRRYFQSVAAPENGTADS